MGINITILVVASLVVVSILGVCVIVLTVYCICYRTSNGTIPTSRHSAGLHDTSNNFQSEYANLVKLVKNGTRTNKFHRFYKLEVERVLLVPLAINSRERGRAYRLKRVEGTRSWRLDLSCVHNFEVQTKSVNTISQS